MLAMLDSWLARCGGEELPFATGLVIPLTGFVAWPLGFPD